MEFDNNISLKEISSFEMVSGKTEDVLWEEVWEDLHAHFKNVGHAGNGEFWIDYSTGLRTQYMVCKINRHNEKEDGIPDDGQFHIHIYGGTKAGRTSDVLILILILGAFWGLGKAIVPQPQVLHILLIAFCALVIVGMLVMLNTPFGEKEAAALEKLIRDHR